MGGNISFRKFLVEGGNVKVGEFAANSMDLKKIPRKDRQRDVAGLMHGINNHFLTTTGNHLFGSKGEGIDSGEIFAGSSKAFMDSKISDDEHLKYKPTVGDIDTMYPEEHKELLGKSLTPGTRYGKYTLRGVQKSGTSYHGLFQHDNGETHQVDFEPQPFENGKPNDWAQFSHSSDWNDVKTGLKGIHHKLLLSSLTAAHGQPGIVRTPKGDIHQFIEKHSLGVDRGLRLRHEAIKGEDNVFRELKPDETKTEQSLPKIYKTLFGKEPTDDDMKDFGSFHGVLSQVKKNMSPEQRGRITDKFVSTLYNPKRARAMSKDPKTDMKMKDTALNFFRKHMKDHFTPDKEQEIADMKKEYYQNLESKAANVKEKEARKIASLPKKRFKK